MRQVLILWLILGLAPSARASEVTITTDPEGAEVWVGSSRVGLTTKAGLRFATPDVGPIKFLIRKEGFEPVSRTVVIDGVTKAFAIDLVLRRADAPPSGAQLAASPSPSPVSLGMLATQVKAGQKTGPPAPVYELTGASSARAVPPIPDNVPITILDAMRKRAEEVFRPRMTSIAPSVKEFKADWRHYKDACEGRTTAATTETDAASPPPPSPAPGPSEETLTTYRSEASWRRQWSQVTLTRNEDTPACRTIESDLENLAEIIIKAMDGADNELKVPPSVYPGIADEVFVKLRTDLW